MFNKPIIKRSRHFNVMFVLSLILSSVSVQAQTYVTAPLSSTTLTPGRYFNNGSIVMNPGFGVNGTTGAYNFYITTDCIPLATTLSSGQNYIVTSIPRTASYIPGAAGYTTCNVMQTVQYFDGLGRPLQTVRVKGTPTGNDLVQPIAYDQFGREAVKYLPYASSTSDGSYKADALISSSITSQSGFYKSPQTPAGVSAISAPQAATYFEPSPLNRIVEQGSPGDPWQLSISGVTGSGHTIKIAYGINAATDVILWTVNAGGTGATGTSNYMVGQLYSTTTTDENGNNSIEYQDNGGHIVCKKVQSGTSTYLATYYVYDDFNNLTYVIPPIPVTTAYPTSFLEADAVFLNFIYGYHYDGRSRLVERKVPGKGWQYLLYNAIDQVVATQDAIQRGKTSQEWTFVKYDAQSRAILTGIYKYGSTPNTNYRTAVQALVTGALWETPINTGTGYTANAWPTTWTGSTLSTNYYDKYTNVPNMPPGFVAPTGASIMTNGLLVASGINVLGSSDMLWTVHYYDDLGRITQTYVQHYLGGTLSPYNYDRLNNTYDFTNEITGTTRLQYAKNAGNTAAILKITIVDTFVYDHMGRKKQTFENINNTTNILLSQNDYNELGQVMTKHFHSSNSGQSFLQDISYAYNERGWLSKINDPAIAPTSNKLFAEQLNYNLPQYGAAPQFNSNIAEQDYNAGISARQHVTYSYDQLNRLSNGTSTTGLTEIGITYDNLGNLLTLTRSGTGNGTLTYGYTGNQLTTLSGFKSGTNVYDNNGNLMTDGTRGATISYNLLNLPQTVTATGVNITYTYDAGGNKLRKVSNGTSTDYVSGIQYKSDAITIDFIQTEEGRAINAGSSYNYEYTLTDHLGNNRITFDQTNGKVGEDDYYPFGLNVHRQVNAGNNYLYNKKELQNELTEYDYGARFYDPAIARMTTVDRFAEKYMGNSPYQYGADNPISNIDMNGDSVRVNSTVTGNKVLNKAFNDFAGTKAGRKFLAKYAAKGQTINGYTFTANGKYNDKGIDLNYGAKNLNDNTIGGQTDQSIGKDGRAEIDVTLNTQSSPEAHSFGDQTFDKSMTIAHESFIHVDLDTKDFLDNGKFDNSNIDRSIINTPGMTPNHYQHIQVLNDYIRRGYYPGSGWPLEGYKAMQEINQQNNAGRTPAQIMQKLWNYSGGVQIDSHGKTQ